MSRKPNQDFEVCLNHSNNDSIKNMTLSIEETPFLDLIPLNPLNPIKRLTHF